MRVFALFAHFDLEQKYFFLHEFYLVNFKIFQLILSVQGEHITKESNQIGNQ